MLELSPVLTGAVVAVALMAAVVGWRRARGQDARPLVAFVLSFASMVTIGCGIQVLSAAQHASPGLPSQESDPTMNGLFLLGLLLVLLGCLTFFVSLGVLVWRLVDATPSLPAGRPVNDNA